MVLWENLEINMPCDNINSALMKLEIDTVFSYVQPHFINGAGQATWSFSVEETDRIRGQAILSWEIGKQRKQPNPH
jgi:hypothetical protein